MLVLREDPAACPRCQGPLEQDPDVLDTWFSSALWPFSTLGWPERTQDLATFYPTSLLITGFDILFFWVARMIMMGVHFRRRDGFSLAASVPFRQVHIHGLVRDAERQKMSKTKGNVIDPMNVAERFGTDAVRFTLVAMAVPGGDIALSEGRMEGYQAFANKIWNAARFLFMTLDRAAAAGQWTPHALPAVAPMRPQGNDPVDRWLFSRLNAVARRVAAGLAEFRFHDVADALYHFIWHEFCDWYLELIKLRLAPGASGAQVGEAAENLFAAFDVVLRLLHPFMPFITEELWRTLAAGAGAAPPAPTLALAAWPVDAGFADAAAECQLELVQEAVSAVRARRAARQISPREGLALRLEARRPEEHAPLAANLGLIERLANVKASLAAGADSADPRLISTERLNLVLDLGQAFDAATERARLAKQREEARARLAAVAARLADPRFTERAPAHVRAEQERKRDEYTAQIEQLDQVLAALDSSAAN